MSAVIRVLYVDDDATSLHTRGRLLDEHERLEVIGRQDVDSGLQTLSNTRIDCILSDYAMPDRDGLTFLQAVRADYPELPFIFFSSLDSEAVVTEAFAAGATDFLPKSICSISYELVTTRIISAVENYRLQQSSTDHR